MISTRHYYLNTSLLEWNIAHVFEHVIILAAKSRIAAGGYPIDLFGWISGETFEKQLFIDAGFYQNEASALFDEFMISSDISYKRHIAEAISMVEAEEKSTVNMSADDIIGQFPLFDTLQWNTLNAIKPSMTSTVPSQFFMKSAKKFRDLSIVISAKSLTPNEQKVFLRLRPILIDIASEKLSQNLSLYSRGASPVFISNNIGKFFFVITTKNMPGRLTRLEELVTNHIQAYPVAKKWPTINAHFEVFATEPLWADTPTDYYRHSGIVTTTAEIADLATKSLVNSVFSKIRINIRTASAHEKTLTD